MVLLDLAVASVVVFFLAAAAGCGFGLGYDLSGWLGKWLRR